MCAREAVPGRGRRQQGQGNVGRGWHVWLVTAPLAESVLGTRRHAERPAHGSQASPQSLCAGSFSSSRGDAGRSPAGGSALPICYWVGQRVCWGFFPIRCWRKDQKDLSGQPWTSRHWLCLYQGGQTLPVKSPRVNIFSSLGPISSAMTTLAAQRSQRPHAHEWPWHSTNKTLSQTDSGQFWLRSPACRGLVYVKVGGSHVRKADECQEGAGLGLVGEAGVYWGGTGRDRQGPLPVLRMVSLTTV